MLAIDRGGETLFPLAPAFPATQQDLDPMMDSNDFHVEPLHFSKHKSSRASLGLAAPSTTTTTTTAATATTSAVAAALDSHATYVQSQQSQQSQQQSSGQMTPPLTPSTSSEDLAPQCAAPHMQFHDYLRAFYPFHPPCDDNSSTVTLPLNQGDIILIHSVHTNGWADGTLLDSGHRGWLPTNYCTAYDPEPIRNLMKALTAFYDVVRRGSEGNYAPFYSQDYTRGLIAGVRYLLVKTDCLNREDALVSAQTGHSGLRRSRKALLSDLSGLVKQAKELEASLKESLSLDNLDEQCLDSLILKAFKMVLRGVRFYDIWFDVIEYEPILYADLGSQGSDSLVPPTPPADQSTFADVHARIKAREQQHQQQQLDLESLSRSSTGRTSSHMRSPSTEDATRDRRDRDHQTALRQRLSYSSQSQHGRRSRTSQCLAPSSSRPSSISTARQSASHRISWSTRSTGVRSSKLASERLITAHETFLAYLGSFIGIHLSSRTSTEILVTTQRSVESGRRLLTVVEAVWDRGMCKSQRLEEVRDCMYSKITDLVHSAQRIFNAPSPGADKFEFDSEGRTQLADAATSCMRAASECVASTRYVLETIGDFEFETLEDSSTFSSGECEGSEPFSPVGEGSEQQEPETPIDLADYPPEPANEPPLPPMAAPALPSLEVEVPLSGSIRSSAEVSISCTRRSSDFSLIPLPSLSSSMSTTEGCSPLSTTLVSGFEEQVLDGSQVKPTSTGLSSPVGNTALDHSAQKSEGNTMYTTSSSRNTGGPEAHQRRPSEAESAISRNNSNPDTDVDEVEATVIGKTYAHEIMFNKDGQITGGTLRALIERLTTHDSTPDALFVSTFFLTFRIFATPTSLAQALIDRFEYVEESKHISGPVRLRVYNVFKGWLESHWRMDCDAVALDFIVPFASKQLSAALPAAGARLLELASKVSESSSPLVPRLVSSIGKTNTAVAQYVAPDAPLPSLIITKSQLNLLRAWRAGSSSAHPQVLDFDPLELARQLTLKVSRIFCSILPEELLGTEWTKKSGSIALNVRAMSTLSTDLANLVAESVLHFEGEGRRAKIIKHWVKIASKCMELNNYDSLMAIVCSLNSTTILRLKRTWECVSAKTKATLEGLRKVVDCSRNYTVLRQRLAGLMPPCLPFVGIYLTDLTFVDAGNQSTRLLHNPSGGGRGSPNGCCGVGGLASSPSSPVDGSVGSPLSSLSPSFSSSLSPLSPSSPSSSSPCCNAIPVINFDKHVKTARIISELQRFQIPYRVAEVPELQTWMQDQFVRVREQDEKGGAESNVNKLYRRSCMLEPR